MRKITKHPMRLAGGLYRRLPWYGKILTPAVVLAGLLYLLEWGFTLIS